jgi:hypothetical protein
MLSVQKIGQAAQPNLDSPNRLYLRSIKKNQTSNYSLPEQTCFANFMIFLLSNLDFSIKATQISPK